MGLKKDLCMTVGITIGTFAVIGIVDKVQKKMKEKYFIEEEKIKELGDKLNNVELTSSNETDELLNAKMIRFESYVNNKTVQQVNESALERATKIINGGI